MPFTPHGKHLVSGAWIGTEARSESTLAHRFSLGTPELVAQSCEGAEAAVWSYGYSSRETRATFPDAIADEIEARAEAITQIGSQETGPPEARRCGRCAPASP